VNNFYKLHEGLNVSAIMAALKVNDGLWDQNTLRTTHELTPHKQVSDIWLRFNDINNDDVASCIEDAECINYPAFYKLPEAQSVVFGLMGLLRGERIGRCLITKLKCGGSIEPHVDMGAPAKYYSRYHIVLNGEAGSMFNCGDESVNMRTGEIWWFDNQQEHSVQNNSKDDRIHIIVDIKVFQ
jgi:hypothetical protein